MHESACGEAEREAEATSRHRKEWSKVAVAMALSASNNKDREQGIKRGKGIWVRRGNLDGKPKEDESKEKEDDYVEVEYKMWESCKIEKKEFSPVREQEQDSFEEGVHSKVGGGEEELDQINGVT
ncbi:hypothetical protein ACE6H2_010180 [Prunus campanulata]